MPAHLFRPVRIGIVAGEASGDILGAGLLSELRKKYPDMVVEGIGGPLMQAQGCHSFFAQDRLAVMGLVEPLKRLPELLRIRRFLREHFRATPPDVFIGIDSPDFNLQLECSLRQSGVKTAHYVSPSVWAWRQGRLGKIARAADLVLTLFPFEEAFYRKHASTYTDLQVVCVGHPLADSIPMQTDTVAARAALGLPAAAQIIALLPGSRAGEVSRMGDLFFQVARWCWQRNPQMSFLIPAANVARKLQLLAMQARYPDVPVRLVLGQSQVCMAAADIVLMASGTTTLEAMLLKKPMVVAYKLYALSFAVISRLLKVPYVALPNLLANELLVPELLQQEATVEKLGGALLSLLADENQRSILGERFTGLHLDLARNANLSAAQAVQALIERV